MFQWDHEPEDHDSEVKAVPGVAKVGRFSCDPLRSNSDEALQKKDPSEEVFEHLLFRHQVRRSMSPERLAMHTWNHVLVSHGG